jgi:phosphoribosylformylglycinamidine cyclo-ligase
LDKWERPALFNVLQKAGNVEREEMYRAFNMGIGMVLAVSENENEDIINRLNSLGEQAWTIGEITACSEGSECVQLVE